MIILIDNYDSFTYNLVQYLGTYEDEICVLRNNEVSAQEVMDKNPDGIVISPGPCDPDKAGICVELIKHVARTNIPPLGVCLGHKAIGQAFGGNIIRAPEPIHGKTADVIHNECGIYEDIPSPLTVTRYHSLIIDSSNCPDELEITARLEDGMIMGIQHKSKPIYGVQYHPESIATNDGLKLIENFVKMIQK